MKLNGNSYRQIGSNIMKRSSISFLGNIVVAVVLVLIGCLGFMSCKSRTFRSEKRDEQNVPSDSTTFRKPRPIHGGVVVAMYGTPYTRFEAKKVPRPEEAEE